MVHTKRGAWVVCPTAGCYDISILGIATVLKSIGCEVILLISILTGVSHGREITK